MTAEQLEDLLGKVSDPNNKYAASHMAALWREAPSLARRVICAEGLVEAIKGLDYTTNHIEAALTAYCEASK